MEKDVKYDIEGYDVITTALMELINQYPALQDDRITFSTLSEDRGKALFPTTGAVIEIEKEDVIGNIKQDCLYPFYIVYRASGLSESRKASVKEWLDNLGRWLERQTIRVNGEDYKLEEYPTLTGTRQIEKIERQSPSFLNAVNENKSEDWTILITCKYKNEYVNPDSVWSR